MIMIIFFTLTSSQKQETKYKSSTKKKNSNCLKGKGLLAVLFFVCFKAVYVVEPCLPNSDVIFDTFLYSCPEDFRH